MAAGALAAADVARSAGFETAVGFAMGGTSTDVALVQDSNAQLRRETTVGDVTVRASSVDVRTVGAGGGSIARVPELTGALRVGPTIITGYMQLRLLTKAHLHYTIVPSPDHLSHTDFESEGLAPIATGIEFLAVGC